MHNEESFVLVPENQNQTYSSTRGISIEDLPKSTNSKYLEEDFTNFNQVIDLISIVQFHTNNINS